MASSVRKTANVTGIGSEENIIARYQTAVEEGRLVSEFLEDAGNVALVAGGTGAVLGRTSRVLSTGAGTNSARVLSQVKKGIESRTGTGPRSTSLDVGWLGVSRVGHRQPQEWLDRLVLALGS